MSEFKFGAKVGINIANAKVMDGETFGVAKRFVVPASGAGGIVNIVFDPIAFDGQGFVLRPVKFKAFLAGPIEIDVYAGTDADDGGTQIIATNRNFLSPLVSQNVVRMDPTINTDGDLFPSNFVIFSNGTPAVSVAGGESSEDLVFVLDTTKKYMFRLTNLENVEAQAHFAATWFEVQH